MIFTMGFDELAHPEIFLEACCVEFIADPIVTCFFNDYSVFLEI